MAPNPREEIMSPRPAALVFDAYGTLFDVHSVTTLCDEFWPGHGEQVSRLWRQKQLEYTWLRSLMGRYESFVHVTEVSLQYACSVLNLSHDDVKRASLMQAYHRLAPFPEVKQTLEQLRGFKLAILSNGTPAMLDAIVSHSGLSALIPTVLSVDELKIYKPAPKVYQLAVERLGVAASEIGFVSSNSWDALGAKSFGFRTFWVNRTGLPIDRLGFEPDHQLASLMELLPLVS
jgi:2-haloacid dehalogenase